MKLRVKKRQQLLYPDGSVRGGPGYVVDTSASYDRDIMESQGDVLQPTGERSSPASPVDLNRLQLPSVEAVLTPPKKGKKTKAKKAAKKKKKT